MISFMLFLIGILIFIAGYINRADGIYFVVGVIGLVFFSLIAFIATDKRDKNKTPMATPKSRR